jgi:hypothetical protein
MQEKWQLATAFVRSHPGLELRLTGKRFVEFWMGTESPLKNFRATDSSLIKGILLTSFLTAIGALFGIIALCQRQPAKAFPFAVFPVIFPCLYYVTHADLRYRHPVDPVICLLAALAVAAILDFTSARWKPTNR